MIVSERIVPPSHPCLAGHFPGNPLVPGALLLSNVMAVFEDARPGESISRFARIRFVNAIKPGDTFRIRIFDLKDCTARFEIVCADLLCASGLFDVCLAERQQ